MIQYRKILIPRFDTLGDIVLLEGFIETLLAELPHATVTLLVRDGYDQLAPLFPRGIRWQTTSLHPYRALEESDHLELRSLLDQVTADAWDLLLVTTYNRTWIDTLLAARLAGAQRIALGEDLSLSTWAEDLHNRLGLPTAGLFDQVVPVAESTGETDKYQSLHDALFPGRQPLPAPRLVITPDAAVRARELLSTLGLEAGSYYACVTTCTPALPIKSWPNERFVETMVWLQEEHGIRPLLLGHESERNRAQAVAALAEKQGVQAALWLGQNGELDLLAGLLIQARFYLGNDTGPMHIAATLDLPTVGIFGGGHWPRFLPVGKRAVGLAGDLPCFGCNWDCLFIDGPCFRLVSVEDAKAAIKMVLDKEPVSSNLMTASHLINEEAAEFIGKALTKLKEHEKACALRVKEIESKSNNEIEIIRSSLSWRLTKPLRWLGDRLRR